ncbi:hypothetical protein [Pararhodonellum marinum]|uniref:hypothetical protein n=1 Tax=Pararhodonellum marinum TaxID=2755358 RepID=UPI001E34D11A|nr:hypothetical protein [Pararhodonellum marinum]
MYSEKRNFQKYQVPLLIFSLLLLGPIQQSIAQQNRATEVEIRQNKFFINGQATYQGREWNGYTIEGLLLNSRMVQGVFDDLNPETRDQWKYPDTGTWDADRNTDEFVAEMENWLAHGMLSFTINLQGGSPYGYSESQPWHNSAFTDQGALRPEFMGRLERILDRADQLGMVPILGLFYFGQDERLEDEAAVIRAVTNSINWLHDKGYRNVLIEINNEANINYDHDILQPERVHELIELAQSIEQNGARYYVSTSYAGGVVPKPNVVSKSDFILLHGNGVHNPKGIVRMVEETMTVEGYNNKPILFNEDDHFDFDAEWNNFIAAVSVYASWGYFDYRMKDEPFEEGYQSVPVDWGINSERKKGFFNLMKEITGK